MAFSEEEKAAWLAEKRVRERQPLPSHFRPEPVDVCVCCQRPIAYSEGTFTDEVAICDICNGE